MAYALLATISICSVATLAGVMLSVGYILRPYWTMLETKAFLECFEKTGQLILSLIPFVIVPAVIGLAGCTWLSWKENSQERYMWLCSIVGLALTMMVTRGWFFPENARILSGTLEAQDMAQRLKFWLQLHNLRIGLLLVSAAAGVRAVCLSALLRG